MNRFIKRIDPTRFNLIFHLIMAVIYVGSAVGCIIKMDFFEGYMFCILLVLGYSLKFFNMKGLSADLLINVIIIFILLISLIIIILSVAARIVYSKNENNIKLYKRLILADHIIVLDMTILLYPFMLAAACIKWSGIGVLISCFIGFVVSWAVTLTFVIGLIVTDNLSADIGFKSIHKCNNN